MNDQLTYLGESVVRVVKGGTPGNILVALAKDAGALIPEPCWVCFATPDKSHAHHPDPERYDEIQWLCRRCHMGIHANKLACDKVPITIAYRPKAWPPTLSVNGAGAIVSINKLVLKTLGVVPGKDTIVWYLNRKTNEIVPRKKKEKP